LPSRSNRAFDVAIAGGGPAGCAAALSLRTHAPGLSIALIEKTAYTSARPGEVLPGAARGLLGNLGIRDAFERECWRPVYAAASAWGMPVLRENHSIYSWPGHGWHLDRAKFDRFLVQQAEARGVAVRTGVRTGKAERVENGWRLEVSGGAPIEARFIVDATGRAASIARQIGTPPVSLDPLTAFSRYFAVNEDSDSRTLIEAVADGWWYTAALTGNQRVATFLTDPDIARRHRLDLESNWREALSQTQFTKRVVPATASVGDFVRLASSAWLPDPAGDRWLVAGDAACAYDPLSGQGIARALRSGILASFAIADYLVKGSSIGIERYRHFCRHGWSGYVEARRRYYLEEQRWPDRSFWRRRIGFVK
jgi:flavin-dependent dehydrogenase